MRKNLSFTVLISALRLACILVIFNLFLVFNINAQSYTVKADTVEVIKEYKNLYRYQNFFLGGQPTLETLQWLESECVTKIINLRSGKENKEYAEYAYDEKNIAEGLGLEYIHLSVDGIKEFTPEKLNSFLNLINEDENIMIHCLSGGRVSYFFMAYLIRDRGFSVHEAMQIGRKLKFSFPLEKLLETEISMKMPKSSEQKP